jgi:hypothetical protein
LQTAQISEDFMDHKRTAQWLLENAGAVIRIRVAVEYPEAQEQTDVKTLLKALLEDATVNQWLENLKPYQTLVEARQQGKGLGAGGHSSFLHGATDLNFEVVLPKLTQLGVQAGMPVLDEKTASWLQLLEAGWSRSPGKILLDDAHFLSAVYFYYDYQLIIASSLALAGYIGHEAVEQVLRSRLEAIYEVIKNGNFDIYEKPGKFSLHPKEWGDHLLKWDIYSDGNIRLPFIHDICGFSYLRKHADQETKSKIGAIIQWVLAPECQRFIYNYGYIRCPDGRGKSVGWKMDLPGYFGHDDPDFDPRALVLRCWQMAQFPESREHPWFQLSIQHLESFITRDGTFCFPKRYLTETRARGYWIHGSRMGLGENRRNPKWLEIESTFWMFAIYRAIASAV